MTLNTGGNLTGTLKDQAESMVRKQFSMKPIVQLLEREVIATEDSTALELKRGKVVSQGVRVLLLYVKMVLKGGKADEICGRDSSGIDLPPARSRRLRLPVPGKPF